MHTYNPKLQNRFTKSEGLGVPGALPDLPTVESRTPVRRHGVWLRRVAVCFVLVSLFLTMRSAFAQPGAP